MNVDFYWKIFDLIDLIPNLESLNIHSFIPHSIDDQIKIGVNLFSSSLICLSLNFICLSPNDLFCSNSKLEEFLKPMKELKRFDLYSRIPFGSMNN